MADAISSSIFSYDKNAGVVFLAPKGKKYNNFKCSNRHSPSSIIKSMKKCDIFILGGGTLISESSSKRSAFYYTLMLCLAGIMKKQRVIYSSGIDRISSRLLKRLLKTQLKDVRISLRDTASLDALWDIIPSPEAKIHADAVFLSASRCRSTNTVTRKHIAVCIKKDSPADLGILIGDFCQKYSLLPVFVATSPADMSECEKQSRLAGGSAILLHNMEDAKTLFESSLLCLSARYHAILLAACFGCIPISMSGAEKILALMSEMNLLELILPAKYSYNTYQSKMEQVLSNVGKYEKQCRAEVKKMLRRAKLAEAYLGKDQSLG